MKEATKRGFTLGYSIILIVLAAAFAFMSIMPAISLDPNRYNFPKEIYNGRFTKNMKAPEEIGVGFKTVIDIVTNWNDMMTVLVVQGDEAAIQEKKEDIVEMVAKGYSEDTIKKEQDKLSEMQTDFYEYLDKLSEDDIERIEDRLQNDETFINLIGAVYGISGAFASDTEDVIENSSKLGLDILDITVMVLGIILFLCLIGTAMIFPVIIIIKFIVFLIKSLIHIANDSDKAIDNRMDKFPFTSYTATMLMFCMMYSLVSTGVGIGMAIKGALAILLAVCLLRAVKTILFADKGRVQIIVKQAITLVSIFAAVMLLLNFIGVDLINEFDDVIVDMSLTQYDAEYEELVESGRNEGAVKSEVEKTVSAANGKNTAIVVTISILGAMLIVIAVINAIERFGNKKMKLKTGELVPYKAMVVLSVFLLVLAIVPTVLAVDSEKARDEAFEAGQFKIWYTEYQEEDTKAYIEYEGMINLADNAEDMLDDLYDELEDADDDEEAEEIEKFIEYYETRITFINEEIDEIEARAKRPTNCIIFAVIFLIAEYAYLITSKVMEKCKKKAKKVNEAPVEEAPVEEAPAEEAPVEEAPVEEAPVEEAPAEEAPVEEAPVEE